MLPNVAHGVDLAFDTPLPESRRHQHPVQIAQHAGAVVFIGQRFGLYPLDFHFALVTRPGVDKRLGNGLVGIAQFNVFTHQTDGNRFARIFEPPQKRLPVVQIGILIVVQVEHVECPLVESFLLHQQRHVVNRFGIDGFDHRRHLYVAELRDFPADLLRQRVLGAAGDDVGLNAIFEQHPDRVLRGLGFQLPRRLQIRH